MSAATVARQPLLLFDAGLCAGVSQRRRARAERTATARIIEARPGQLRHDGLLAEGEAGFGLLVVSGLLCRHVGAEYRAAAELVGSGDVFRPWDAPGAWASIPTSCRWNVLMPTRLAILDRHFAQAAAPFPEIAIAIHKRGLERTAHLATLMGLANHRRVETRLLHLFWHLADRFGSVGDENVTIPLLLTHAVIAEMAALRRPSVSSGLARLDTAGLLRRTGDGWNLHRATAEQLLGRP
jgi:hypothetical protein